MGFMDFLERAGKAAENLNNSINQTIEREQENYNYDFERFSRMSKSELKPYVNKVKNNEPMERWKRAALKDVCLEKGYATGSFSKYYDKR